MDDKLKQYIHTPAPANMQKIHYNRFLFQLFLSDNDSSPERGNRQNAKQDAERKKLPSIPSPDLDEYMNRSVAKQKADATASAVLNSYGPYFMEYTLLAE
jgi:hypothetical protein